MNHSEEPVGQTEESGRRLFYAWIGAMATAYDAAEDTFEQFVQRGREASQELQQRSDQARQQSRGAGVRVRDSFRTMMDGFLSSMDMPTKSEIDAMNVKLNILMRKLDDLAMQQSPVTHPGQPEVPPTPDTDLAT